MNYCIDYSWARPDPHAIKAAGYTGVLRYVSRPDNNGKNISKAEMDRLRAAGLDVTLNFEQYERRPLEGYSAGTVDARTADRIADIVGYPKGCAIYYSVDFGTSWPAVRDYFRGVRSASRRPVGIYAGLPLCHSAMDEGLAQYGWITNAASWSGLDNWTQVQATAIRTGRCHLLQHLHLNTPHPIAGIANTDFDPNTVLQAHYGQWSANDHNTEEFLSMLSDADQLKLVDAINHIREYTELLVACEVPGGWEHRPGTPGAVAPRTQQILALAKIIAGQPTGDAPMDPKALADTIVDAIGPEVAKAVSDELAQRLQS